MTDRRIASTTGRIALGVAAVAVAAVCVTAATTLPLPTLRTVPAGQLVTPDPQYPVDRTQTYFVRDDIVVTVDQTNVPTDDLIGSIATRLWG